MVIELKDIRVLREKLVQQLGMYHGIYQGTDLMHAHMAQVRAKIDATNGLSDEARTHLKRVFEGMHALLEGTRKSAMSEGVRVQGQIDLCTCVEDWATPTVAFGDGVSEALLPKPQSPPAELEPDR